MISLSLICNVVSVVCFYAVARKVERPQMIGLSFWPDKNPILFRGVGFLAALLGIILLINAMGAAVGIIASLALWTCVASLVLLFVPFLKKPTTEI